MKLSRAVIGSSWVERLRKAFPAVVVAAMLVSGCQGTLGGVKGQHIQKQAQIPIVKTGQQSGKYSDGYVTVKYKYTATDSSLQLSGVASFDSPISGNFSTVQTFDLGLLLGDEQAKILLQQGLTTAVENSVSDVVNFTNNVLLPPQAGMMAFTYNGMAYGDGLSPTTFWSDPVER